MNILFMTTGRMNSMDEHGLYPDLLRALRDRGHAVYAVGAYEKRVGKETAMALESGIHVLRVRIGNLTKCNVIEKGISTLMIESQYRRAIDKFFGSVKFDLVLYSTPPITLVNVVRHIKRKCGAKSYLVLKDIFPQNAVDIGMMKKSGIMGLLHAYFRNKEKQLYAVSDRIGCMSGANCDYVIAHNPEVDPRKVELCPNAIEIRDVSVTPERAVELRRKYGLPLDRKVFVYGGNLGKPQDVPFVIRCLKAAVQVEDAFFLVVGNGTDASKLHEYMAQEKPSHVLVLDALPKDEYDAMIAACDVGLIFLDYRFTIPNYPSRLLAYMQAGLPVLACTDPNTDVGKTVTEGGFGWWCPSNDPEQFVHCVRKACAEELAPMQVNAATCLRTQFRVDVAADMIDAFLNT